MLFEAGNVVKLKTNNGQQMIIKGREMMEGTTSTTHWVCTWFDKNNTRNIDSFHQDTIVKVEELNAKR
jgi:uncharacterized protein YodC (DUF2158 family)